MNFVNILKKPFRVTASGQCIQNLKKIYFRFNKILSHLPILSSGFFSRFNYGRIPCRVFVCTTKIWVNNTSSLAEAAILELLCCNYLFTDKCGYFNQNMQHFFFSLFHTTSLFLYTWKHQKTTFVTPWYAHVTNVVFRCFHGVWKKTSDMKWIDKYLLKEQQLSYSTKSLFLYVSYNKTGTWWNYPP